MHENPLPNNLDDAIKEIRALQGMIKRDNEKVAKRAEKYAIDLRSLKGTVRRLTAEVKKLREQTQP